ncbi:conserved hypothetical protein [Flavobacterium sp. 9R]|jgi:hypothetical protein|uniref:hypothetical protein n=1 Tax=unclassified Flavobacterium TaxID=196869 RepID=UPI0012EF2086|nr:hypothetical protein [Flavobacterium sp. 9R]MBP7395882.1 hypothetical protein [Flavobacterium sp.]TAF71888.1 MAG: hypothetical protein EAZ58_03370 [Flavobacterium sp.]VXB99605.1 conserved hypothetical protein [Flavobacterium sp. 9R]
MKKIITIAVLLFSVVTFGQIKVLQTVPIEKLGRVNSNFYIQKMGDEYTVYYASMQNEEEAASVKKFTFKDVDNAYNSLHTIITNGFSASPLSDIKLELPNNYVWLHYNVGGPGKVTVQFMVSSKEGVSNNISEPLTPEQVDKLFQKA